MALRRLSKKQFLPVEIQELIWEFGWHLNLGVITQFGCVMENRDVSMRNVHFIYRAFVMDPPRDFDRGAYMAILGIPYYFNPLGRPPRVRVHPPCTTTYPGPLTIACDSWEYSDELGFKTWAHLASSVNYAD